VIIGGGTFSGGTNMFYGGSTATMVATQTVVLSPADRLLVAGGGARSSLSAYIGGFSSQGDYLSLSAEWRDAGGNAVLTQVLDPVTRIERRDRSGFLPRQSIDVIPASATRVVITLTGTRFNGTVNDGYIDNISLQLVTGNPPQLSKAFAPSVTQTNVPARLTLTIANPDPQAANDWLFTDDLPIGLLVAGPPNTSTTCPGTSVFASAGAQTVVVSGDVAASSSCTIGVDVVSATEGAYVNGASNIGAIGLLRPTQPATLTVVQPADLSIAKSASTTQPKLGDTFTYALTVKNNGPGIARNVTVSDVPGAGVQLQSAASTTGSCSAADSCQLGDMVLGATATITVTARATQEGPSENTATVATTTPEADASNNTAKATVQVQPLADVSISKSASTTTPAVGETFTYLLTVRSNGPSTARNVAVSDAIGPGVQLLSATPSTGLCSATSSCQLGDLVNGALVTIAITARATAEGTVGNTAHVTTSTADRDPSNDIASATVQAHPRADLQITKTASESAVHEGEHFSYTLEVVNHGPSIARDATVTDSLPAGVALESASTSRGTCSQSDPVICRLSDLPSGGTATITLHVRATDAGRPENTAIVESPTTDPSPANNSDHTAVTTDRLADLAISKSASTPAVTNGEALDYTLKVVNHGPSRALGAVVTDTIPSGLRIEAASSSRGTCAIAGQTIACELGDIGSDGTATITVTVLTTKGGSYTNTASVTSETPDSDAANNLDDTAVEVAARTDVAIAKTATDATALVGETVTYAITVTNNGPDDAADVTVTDPLPAAATFVSAKPSDGTCGVAAGALVCDLGSVAPGAAVTIRLQLRLTQTGDTRNVAQVTTSTPDTKPSNNRAATSTTAEKADVALTKTASTSRPSIGQTVTYTITARNAGPAIARGVVVTDPIPASLKYVSAKASAGSCTVAQGALVCNVGDIAAGRSATVSLKAIVRRVGDAGNAASAVSRYPDDPSTANNLARSAVEAAAPHLTLRKTVSRASVSTGGHVTFTLRVRNAGGSTAHQVLVCDEMPSGLVATSTSPRARLRSGAYCWALGSLAPGRSKTLTILTTPLSSARGRHVNHATLNARDARPLTASRAVRVDRIRVLGGGVTG
jgi:uncharacterized repeat protein (TIGR01451 family)